MQGSVGSSQWDGGWGRVVGLCLTSWLWAVWFSSRGSIPGLGVCPNFPVDTGIPSLPAVEESPLKGFGDWDLAVGLALPILFQAESSLPWAVQSLLWVSRGLLTSGPGFLCRPDLPGVMALEKGGED